MLACVHAPMHLIHGTHEVHDVDVGELTSMHNAINLLQAFSVGRSSCFPASLNGIHTHTHTHTHTPYPKP